jgi:hypothetical protein
VTLQKFVSRDPILCHNGSVTFPVPVWQCRQ